MRLTNPASPLARKLSFRYNYRFLWHPDVRHINGLLTLTPEFSFPMMQGWIAIPLAVCRSLQHLPWLFLHAFLHYTERELNMCQTESKAVPQACQWLWGWAQGVELGAGKVTQDCNSFPLTITWNTFQPLSKHNSLPSDWILTRKDTWQKTNDDKSSTEGLRSCNIWIKSWFKLLMVPCGLFFVLR